MPCVSTLDDVADKSAPGLRFKGFLFHCCASSFSNLILYLSEECYRSKEGRGLIFKSYFYTCISLGCVFYELGLDTMPYFCLWEHISAGLTHIFVCAGVICVVFLAD